MFQDYRINERKLREAAIAKGFPNLAALLRKARLHRNSLNEYVDGRRSVFSAVTRKICDVLECDPLSLLARQDEFTAVDDGGQILRQTLVELAASRPTAAFFLLGSRARGNSRPFSDWDIAVSGGSEGLSVDEYLNLKSALEDRVEDLPVSVDLVNFDRAPRWFLSAIDYAPKLLAGNATTFAHALGVIDGARKT